MRNYTSGKKEGEMGKALKGGWFVMGMNVRRDRRNPEIWRCAALGEAVRTDGWMPWKQVVMSGAPGKVCVWFRKGHNIGYGIAEVGESVDIGMSVTTATTLKGEPVDVADIKGGWMRIAVKGNRAVYATYTAEGVVTVWGEMPELPWLHFERYDENVASIGVGSIGLSGKSNAQGSSLDDPDLEIVSDGVMKAYSRLKKRINGTGRFMQPVIARYRLLDGNGSTVVSSPPVLVGCSTGMQDCGEISLVSTDSLASLTAGSINSRGFRLKLCGMGKIAAPWNRLATRAVVELSGELDPLVEEGSCSARVSNDGKVCTVTARLPAGDEKYHRMKIADALRRVADYNEYLIIDNPFGPEAEVSVSIPVYATAVRTVPNGEGIAAHPLRDGSSYGGITQAANRYVAWDEIRELWRGYPPECFVTATGSGSWRALSEVKMSVGGEESLRFSNASSGDVGSPAEFSPLLIYPDTAANELTLSLSTGGTIKSENFRLTQLPEAGCCFYLKDGLSGIMPRDIIERMPVQPVEISRKAERPGMTVVFADAVCSRRIDTIELGNGCIRRIVAAPRNNGSWDFARSRLLLFGADGIHIATLDGDGKFHSCAPLDNRSVAAYGAVTGGAGKKGLAYFAIAGGDVVAAERSGVSTLVSAAAGEKAGWCGKHNEIWLWDGTEGLRRINPDRPHEIIKCTVDGIDTVSGMTEWEGGLLIGFSNGKVYDVSAAAPADRDVDIAYAIRFANPQKRGGVQLLEIPLRAAEFKGRISICGDNGSELPELLCRYSVEGAVNSGLRIKIAAPWREFLELHIAGKGKQLVIGWGDQLAKACSMRVRSSGV